MEVRGEPVQGQDGPASQGIRGVRKEDGSMIDALLGMAGIVILMAVIVAAGDLCCAAWARFEAWMMEIDEREGDEEA